MVDSEKERRHIADALNKIYIESFDVGSLGDVLETLGESPKNLGSLKRLQRILELTFPDTEVSTVMAPLFVLYDLRVSYSHLGSDAGTDKELQSIQERLNLSGRFNFFTVYKKIVRELSNSFNTIDALFKKNT